MCFDEYRCTVELQYVFAYFRERQHTSRTQFGSPGSSPPYSEPSNGIHEFPLKRSAKFPAPSLGRVCFEAVKIPMFPPHLLFISLHALFPKRYAHHDAMAQLFSPTQQVLKQTSQTSSEKLIDVRDARRGRELLYILKRLTQLCNFSDVISSDPACHLWSHL